MAAENDVPRCGSTDTATGRPCRSHVKEAGQLCPMHDPSVTKCDEMTKKNTRCKMPAIDGCRKCEKHAVAFLRAGGNKDDLRSRQPANAAMHPAEAQVNVSVDAASSQLSKLLGQTTSYNPAESGDIVRRRIRGM